MVIPDRIKVAVLFQMIPNDLAKELRMKYNTNESQNYFTVRDHILEYIAVNADPKGPSPMQLDTLDDLDEEQWTELLG